MSVDTVERHLVSERIRVAADEALAEVSCGPTAGGKVVRTAHLDVVDVEDTIVALVLVPPIRHPVGVLVNVQTVDERVAVGINVPFVAPVVR